ncbi:MAG: YicC family protein [Bacteroidetes bacterium GWF2_42_66]|nr:MAG: YicC family protein [Bacteroidetes bacterium GWA2_42_15]OFX98075.1 MAG: YicC family protein [Bacteroidetes bacterium GWE2_42_39]OFY42458.1 MAG: YicC family protein [Bacteroidetes bacterium GWF2_42_66]HBL74169.1 YicC family protein [Prolixibacteraceae bacterium]HCR91655.1 YicC family protein [Prolixibacteraceae bacterium]
MIKSMTGFGKAEFEVGNKKITLEIKSLNSKQLDINTRIPALYREKDIEIRKLISEYLVRGKVDLAFYIENLGEETNAAVNESIVKSYFRQMEKINAELNIPISELTIQSILRLPDAVKMTYEQLDEEEWKVIRKQLIDALKMVNVFREQEGDALEIDVRGNIETILSLLKEVEPYEGQRIETVKARIKDSMDELQLNGNFDKNRFEQELIYYLEKLDINEEKVRLLNHCQYFLETLHEDSVDSGRKLGFIAQEIGREVNTLGSKANESNIQKIVVKMKDNLERVKEQVLNVL